MKTIRVFVADDHIHAVEGLRYIIDQARDMAVVGQANSILEVLDLPARAQPDVIVLDMAWPGDKMAGAKLIPHLRNTCPAAQIVAITNYPELIDSARNNGAYPLSKGFSKAELLDTIRWVVKSKEDVRDLDVPAATDLEPLTRREEDVLRLLGQGLKDKEIADELIIAEGTVKKHVSSILGKLSSRTRTEAVVTAKRHRLL